VSFSLHPVSSKTIFAFRVSFGILAKGLRIQGREGLVYQQRYRVQVIHDQLHVLQDPAWMGGSRRVGMHHVCVMLHVHCASSSAP
jgi:hypothetical protein